MDLYDEDKCRQRMAEGADCTFVPPARGVRSACSRVCGMRVLVFPRLPAEHCVAFQRKTWSGSLLGDREGPAQIGTSHKSRRLSWFLSQLSCVRSVILIKRTKCAGCFRTL